MAQNHNTHDNTNDAFADLPAANKATNSNSFPVNKSSSIGKNTDTTNTKSDTKSTGFTVKKITSSHYINPKPETNPTGLNTVSIDTDSFNKNNKQNENPILSKTSIETDSFSSKDISNNTNFPLIIDETDNYESPEIQKVQPVSIKKDKPVSKEQNITIDITSSYCNPSLPSGNKQEQLGTGNVVSVLGSGGMAKVYKIWNDKLEIFRAVKILLPTNQKELWDRFLTEAKITAKLHHQNIIETYDTAEWHGLPTIEMEYIDGDTIASLLSMHPMIPSPVCVSIAVQVARALAYAHSQKILIYGREYNGIIHRDLKPSNIMITQQGVVKLMDFGVARPIETGLHTVATDSIVGTIHYFSPEQISGYPIDTLSDVYSFGAVLYEIISGQNPFPYTNMVTMIQAKTKNQFKRLEEFHKKVDDRVSSVAQTCMRTDKRERFASIDIVRKILEEIHASYNMGSPEEIIAAFYHDPQQVQIAFERFYINRQRQTENTHSVQTNQVSLPPQQELQSTVHDENYTDKNVQMSTSSKVSDLTSWESRKANRSKPLILAVIVLLVAALGGGYIFKSINKKGSGTTIHTDNTTQSTSTYNEGLK